MTWLRTTRRHILKTLLGLATSVRTLLHNSNPGNMQILYTNEKSDKYTRQNNTSKTKNCRRMPSRESFGFRGKIGRLKLHPAAGTVKLTRNDCTISPITLQNIQHSHRWKQDPFPITPPQSQVRSKGACGLSKHAKHYVQSKGTTAEPPLS